MEQTALYNLSPALHVMLLGASVALGPLGWFWLRNRQAQPRKRFRALALLTLFLTFDLVMFGAFTRLTDSGLGCPDWPGCWGNASPSGAHEQISQAQSAMPTGPVTHAKAWIEMLHRYLATAVGVLIATLTAAAWWLRRRGVVVSAWWATAALLWVCVQGAFGALTVTMKLFPAIVTLHLLGGMVLLALLCRQAADAGDRAARPLDRRAHRWLIAAYVVLWTQVALGAWVSTNYAVLACSGFPACSGSWWPPMDLSQGFEFWRPLGHTGTGALIDFSALVGIHYMHRLAACVVVVVAAMAVWSLHRAGHDRLARALGALVLLQVATGLSNVVLGWPLVAAIAHTGGAAALIVLVTWALASSRLSSEGRVSPGIAEASA